MLFTQESLPVITFIIPTYQAEQFIDMCLSAIMKQGYPKDKIEIFIIDGGSTDQTIELAKKYPVTVFHNEKRIAEYGKMIGIREMKGDYFMLIDADNEIIEETWLLDMVRPMIESGEKIFWVESRLAADEKMSSIDRCFARMRIADPMARFLRSRYIRNETKNGYDIRLLKKNHTLITGANGFLWKKSIILPLIEWFEKFEEANMCNRVFRATWLSYAVPRNKWLRHYYCESFREFYEKRKKIAKKMWQRMENNQKDTWIRNTSFLKIILWTIYYLTVIWPLCIAIKNSIRDRAFDWYWYPIIWFFTVLVYLRYLFYRTITFYRASSRR